MKRYFQKVLAVVLSCFTAVQMITPTFAQEQDVSSMSANSIVSVSVQGEGNVVVQESGQSHTVTEDSPLSIETTPDQTISFSIEKQEGLIISSFKENDVNVDTFEVGSEEFNYDYVTTTTETDFVITFDKKQQEESKLNTSVESENEAAKDEDVGQKVDEKESQEQEVINTDDIDLDLTDKEIQKIIDDYAAGKTNKKEYVKMRKQVAKEANLMDYIDEDYFLTDAFFEEFGVTVLNNEKLFVLNTSLTKKYMDDAFDSLKTKLTKAPRGMSVIDKSYWNLTTGPGHYIQNGIWRLSNNQLAFCAEGLLASPNVGDTTSDPFVVDNANMRKALYYGYGGPADQLTGVYGTAGAIVITNELVSNAYCGSCLSKWASGGWNWNNYIGGIWNNVMALPDPAGYTVYMVDVHGNGNAEAGGAWGPKQNLVWGEYVPTGELQISKVSANPDITSGNSCYNLEGAQYGLYTDASATNQINTLTIGSNGWSNTVTGLTAGTYYIKEIKAPQGYALDTKIYSIQVNGGAKATKEMKDYPQSDPISVLLGKIDAETNANKPQGSASLENAQFTVKYYKGLYDTDPAKLGQKPARTWVLKTNSNGLCMLGDNYKVSGDNFYYTSSGDPTLPVGTLTIQETKAPEGYYVNDEVYVRKITTSGSNEFVDTYNEPKVPEQVIKFRIHKAQVDTMTAIPNAVFVHTKPDGSKEELVTDNLGNIEIVGLETGKHSIQEKSVPDGYEINPTKVEFEVKSGGQIIMLTDLTDTGISQAKETDGNTLLTVTDEVSPYDLKLVKINDHDKLLDGAEFTLYEDKECTKKIDVQTTKNGQLEFKNLKDRTNYYFKETKAPQGYRIPFDPTTKAPHVYRVYVESTPAQGKFNFWIDNVMYTVNNTNKDDAVHLEGTTADRVISIEIVNYVGVQLPATGSNMTLIILGIGLAMMTGAYFFNKRKKETKGE